MSLSVDKISMAFGDNEVLQEVSFKISGPRLAAIRGPSGSGKTTLLSIIAGHLKPSSGSVTIEAPHNHVSVDWIVQSAPLLNHRSVLHNIMLGALVQGQSRSLSLAGSVRTATSVGIGDLLRKKSYVLSGGERQRVAIARSVVAGCYVILADEPTASLDATSRRRVCESLMRAARMGSIVLLATHDDYVAEFADEIIYVSPTITTPRVS